MKNELEYIQVDLTINHNDFKKIEIYLKSSDPVNPVFIGSIEINLVKPYIALKCMISRKTVETQDAYFFNKIKQEDELIIVRKMKEMMNCFFNKEMIFVEKNRPNAVFTFCQLSYFEYQDMNNIGSLFSLNHFSNDFKKRMSKINNVDHSNIIWKKV